MKQYNSMYLGICINNNDPEKRGRVQIFVPHVMPTLYEKWNKEGKNIQINCVGDNMIGGLTSDVIKTLSEILPWAESASPILGTSSPGNLLTQAVEGVKGIIGRIFNQGPEAEPANITDLQGLFAEAANWVGSDDRGDKVKDSWSTTRGPGNCLRGTQGILGALTGHPRFNAGKAGGLGSQASLYSTKGGQDFTGTGLYESPISVDSSYMNDSSQWKVGDTVACSGGGKGYGHIQVWTGKAWVSDFTQSRVLPSSASGSYGDFALHRPNAAGQEAISKRAASLIGGQAEAPSQTTTSVSGEAAAANPHAEPTPSSVTDEQGISYGNVANPDVSNNTINLALSTTPQDITLSSDTIADTIIKSEARLDSNGKIMVYNLPSNDGGGSYEIAGINDKYHPQAASTLKNMINSGQADQAKDYAKSYIMDYTKSATRLSANAGTEYALRDITFNRGAGGANWMAKRAAGIEPNLKMNSEAQSAILKAQQDDPRGYLQRLKAAAEEYETTKVGYRANLAKGLQRRFDDRLANSLAILDGKVPMTTSGDYGSLSGLGTINLVNNTDPHGPIVSQNLNNMAKGLFSFPAAGSMIWVFFRDGNPLHPVYFAASYSQDEWKSAYRLGSDGPGYRPASTADNPVTSTGGVMNLNGVGGIRWEDTNNPQNRLQDQKSIMFFGEDGSNIFMSKGYNQYFSKFDRRDQVEGDRWETTLGFKEEWTQGDSNQVTMGDVFVKIGNVSQPAVDAVQRMQQILKEIQQPLSESDS
jgi:hypothetical protein